MSELTILLTGAGAPGASGIIKSLETGFDRSVRLIGVDKNPHAYGFALVDTHYTVPSGDEDGYIEYMEGIDNTENVDVILPLTTAELQPLANARNQFDARVMVSPANSLELANNKGELYAFLDEHDFDAAPAFRCVSTEDEFIDAVTELNYPSEPVCFKPPVASGMRGFRILDETGDRLERLLEEKPGAAVTSLDEVIPVLTAGETFPELIVMEYLPGREYSVDVLARTDGVDPIVPRSRSKTRAGITFEGTVEAKDDLIDAAREISQALGLEYNINLQFRYDSAGQPKLIEINPRVSGTIIMCTGAGANMPELGVRYALGESLPSVEIEWGTRMTRYWQEVFRSPAGEAFHVGPASGGAPKIHED